MHIFLSLKNLSGWAKNVPGIVAQVDFANNVDGRSGRIVVVVVLRGIGHFIFCGK